MTNLDPLKAVAMFIISILFWSLCTFIMILLDSKGYMNMYLAWILGGAMITAYYKLILDLWQT